MADEIDNVSEMLEREMDRFLQTRLEKISFSENFSEKSEKSVAVNCVDCGEEIEERRLKALPSARRCIYCQQILEKRSGRG